MNEYLDILDRAVDSQQKTPSAEETLTALKTAEKNSRYSKPQYQFEQFLGTWRLCFINGTNKSRSRLDGLLPQGFYLPSFTPVKISYSLDEDTVVNTHKGKVVNTVGIGLVEFAVAGPCQFYQKKNILAFDFIYLTLFILGKKIYSQNIRGGKNSEETFFKQNLSQKAFFSYFLVSDKLIAARGRGGGLALWQKIK